VETLERTVKINPGDSTSMFAVDSTGWAGLIPICIKLSPFGRAFDPGVFHGFLVTVGTTKNGHDGLSPLKLSKSELKIDDRFVDPHFTPAPNTAVIVLLRRGAKRNILPILKFRPAFQPLVRICPL